MSPSLTDDDRDDFLLAGRYGDFEDVQSFVAQHGATAIVDIRDENENTILHMVCANGHLGEYINETLPPKSLSDIYRINFRSLKLSTPTCSIDFTRCAEQVRFDSPSLGRAQLAP